MTADHVCGDIKHLDTQKRLCRKRSAVTEGGQTLVVVATEVSVGVVGCLLVVGFAGHVFGVVFDDGSSRGG